MHVTFLSVDTQTAAADAPTQVDTVAPAVPAAPRLSAASDSGASSDDGITNDTTPTVDVGDPGGYYRLARDGVQVSADYAVDTYFTEEPLADGTYAYTLRAVDAAGNASAPSAPWAVTVDTQGPTVSAAGPPAPCTRPLPTSTSPSAIRTECGAARPPTRPTTSSTPPAGRGTSAEAASST